MLAGLAHLILAFLQCNGSPYKRSPDRCAVCYLRSVSTVLFSSTATLISVTVLATGCRMYKRSRDVYLVLHRYADEIESSQQPNGRRRKLRTCARTLPSSHCATRPYPRLLKEVNYPRQSFRATFRMVRWNIGNRPHSRIMCM